MHSDLLHPAKKVLLDNLKTGYSKWAKKEYKYICPSRHHYSHQWFWDSCFHAIVTSHFDLELAKNELRSLVSMQRENGFIPHVIFWNSPVLSMHGASLESKFTLWPKTTELIQPPLLAEAVEQVYEKSEDHIFLLEMLPKLKKYYRWLSEERDPDQDGLISIIAPYESGMDQNPAFDEICQIKSKSNLALAVGCRKVTLKNMLRGYDLEKIFAEDYFNVEDVFVNSVYLKNLEVLIKLLKKENDHELHYFKMLEQKGKKALIKKCFDDDVEFFFDAYSKSERRQYSMTIKGLMPLILDIDLKIVDKLMVHLLSKEEFNLPFPIPTVSARDPDFRPTPPTIFGEPIIWRGPTWVNTNWYIVKGLKRHGFHKIAERVVDSTVRLIEKEGFREFFDPVSGKGFGAKDFGWSTLVIDMVEN